MSYDSTLPTNRDKARMILGDISNDSAAELALDAHYDVIINTLYPTSFVSAIISLADEFAAVAAQKPSSVALPGGLSVSWGNRLKYWTELALRLRSTGSIVGIYTAFGLPNVRNDGYAIADAEL